jgi:hypothetical protein
MNFLHWKSIYELFILKSNSLNIQTKEQSRFKL